MAPPKVGTDSTKAGSSSVSTKAPPPESLEQLTRGELGNEERFVSDAILANPDALKKYMSWSYGSDQALGGALKDALAEQAAIYSAGRGLSKVRLSDDPDQVEARRPGPKLAAGLSDSVKQLLGRFQREGKAIALPDAAYNDFLKSGRDGGLSKEGKTERARELLGVAARFQRDGGRGAEKGLAQLCSLAADLLNAGGVPERNDGQSGFEAGSLKLAKRLGHVFQSEPAPPPPVLVTDIHVQRVELIQNPPSVRITADVPEGTKLDPQVMGFFKFHTLDISLGASRDAAQVLGPKRTQVLTVPLSFPPEEWPNQPWHLKVRSEGFGSLVDVNADAGLYDNHPAGR